jgi:hypothetical protein
MGYLNFAVDVSSLPNGRCRVRVSAPVGETSADLDSPFTPQEIENYLSILGRAPRVSKAQENAAARELGGRLFDFLLRGSSDINAAYIASLERAGSSGLRLSLNVENAGALRHLPWEYLRDPNRDFLALSRLTPVVRYMPQLDVRPPVPLTYPIRVLVMISAPADFPALDVEGEWRMLNDATAELQRRGLMILERLDSATLIALQRRLRGGVYHVFHYIGHSDYDAANGQGLLVFENERDESKGQVISGASLARELAEETTLRLVVLNSCHSARRPDSDALQGIGSSLAARGIPAVVAMQFAITDGAAQAFAEEFYRVLAEMSPIDTALSEARRAIDNRVQSIEWATPVLFMRSDTGILFTPPAADETRPIVRRVPDETRPLSRPSAALPYALLALVVLLTVALVIGLLRGIAPTPILPTATVDPATLPDLLIGNMRIAPRRPAPGEIFTLSFTLTNGGSVDSGAFNWTWDANPTLLDALEGRVENIPPGASKTVSFPYSYGWWGEFITELRVDVDSEIGEQDERNNRRAFTIMLAEDQPFVVDFSLLPNNTVVETPLRLSSETFFPWNLTFAVGDMASSCLDAPLDLLENGDDVILTVSADADPTCALLPLSITIIPAPVADAQIEVITEAAGTAVLRFYSNPSGGAPIFESPPQPVNAGEVVRLGAFDDQPRQIRRIEISLSGQPVRITRLTLLPAS